MNNVKLLFFMILSTYVFSVFAEDNKLTEVTGDKLRSIDDNKAEYNSTMFDDPFISIPGDSDGAAPDPYIPPKSYTFNFNEINNVKTDIPTMTTSLMGDKMDHATGSVTFTHTDVSLPGNFNIEVAIHRSLADPSNWFNGTRDFGNWSLDIPHVRTNFVTNKDGTYNDTATGIAAAWDRNSACSSSLNSNPSFRKSVASGYSQYQGSIELKHYELLKTDYWLGDTVNIPGAGSAKLLQNGSSKSNNMNWKVVCTSVNGVDAFKVTLPNGTEYVFSQLKKVASLKKVYMGEIQLPCLNQCEYPPPPETYNYNNPPQSPTSKVELKMINAFMLVTEITDRYGNKVFYDYDSQGNLDKIRSTDGRLIDVTYTNGRVTKVTANNRVWNYSYLSPTGNVDVYRLTNVKQPDNRNWVFSYPTIGSDFWNKNLIGNHTQVSLFDQAICATSGSGRFINMEHPGGAIGEFTMKEHCFGQSEVPKVQKYDRFGQGSPYQTYVIPKNQNIFALSEKRLTLNDGTEYDWEYRYNPLQGYYYSDGAPDTSNLGLYGFPADIDISYLSLELAQLNVFIEKRPDNSRYVAFFDSRFGMTSGNQVSAAVYDENYRLLQYVTNSYEDEDRLQYYGDSKNWGYAAHATYIEQPYAPGTEGQTAFDLGVRSTKAVRKIDTTMALKDAQGVVTQYKETFENFNLYEQAQRIVQTGPSGKRTITLGFDHSTSQWILNQPTTVDVQLNNGPITRLSQKQYYSKTHYSPAYRFALHAEKWFGQTRKTYSVYHSNSSHGGTTAGSVGQIKHVDLHLEGTQTRRVSFNDYHRGQARTISAPKRYTAGTMSMYKTIDNNGWVTSTKDFNGNTTRYAYHPMGWVNAIDVQDDAGVANWEDTLFTYSYPNGALQRKTQKCRLNASMSACAGSTSLSTTEYFDSFYRVYKVAASGSGQTRFQRFDFDYNNRQTFSSYTSSNSNESRGTSNSFDAIGRMKSVSTSGMGTRQFEYLSNNRIRETSARKHEPSQVFYETTTTFRAFASPSYQTASYIVSPENVTTSMTFDDVGNITHITQFGGGKSQTETRLYDDYNNLCLIKRNDVGNVAMNYNLMGELQWQSYGSMSECEPYMRGNYIDMAYDNLGELESVTYADSTPTLLRQLDNNGNLLKLQSGSVVHDYTYNNLNLIETERLSIPGLSPLNVAYDYAPSQHLASLKYPNNDVVSYAPNAFGEPTYVRKTGQNYASSVVHYPSGSINSFTYGNGITHKTELYSNSNLPRSVKDKNGNIPLVSFEYEYDNHANITSIVDGIDSGYSLTNIEYDGLDRLRNVYGNYKAGNSTVTYDSLGNINTLNTKDRNLSYTYNNVLNRLTRVNSSGSKAKAYGYFTYDTRGNITHNSHFSMGYNLANQMTSANGNSYLYDGHNRRVRLNEKGTLSYSMYSQAGQLLYRKDASGETNYLYLGSRLVAKQKGATPTFLHTDNVGSPVAETNQSKVLSNRMHYKPFGDTYEPPKDDVGYTGHKFDVDLGLSYMQARYYDPVIGRFYSNDPVGGLEHMLTPNGIHGFNRYAYANNNPYKYIDPNGEASKIASLIKLGANALREGARLSKQQAVRVRQQGGNIKADSRQQAKQIETAAHGKTEQLKHQKGHELPDGSQGSPHFQTDGKKGHSFWGVVAATLTVGADALDTAAEAAEVVDPTTYLTSGDQYMGLDGNLVTYDELREQMRQRDQELENNENAPL